MGTEKSYVDMRLREYIETETYLEVSYFRHMYKKHVDMTDDDLRERVRNKGIMAASRFTVSMSVLRKIVRDTLLVPGNLDTIRKEMYKAKGNPDPQSITVTSLRVYRRDANGERIPFSIGKGVFSQNPEQLYDFSRLKVVIVAVPGIGLKGDLPRFKIINMYPVR